jgi:hypothetical protein
MTLDEHYRNREAVPPAELEPYYGKHVAWNMEGTKILASGADELEVFHALRSAGYDPEQVVFSYVPLPDEVMFGWAEYFDWESEPKASEP